MHDDQEHSSSPRSRFEALRAAVGLRLTALRERARRGAATVRHRARHSVEAARERAGVVRHRVDGLGPHGRRVVVIAVVAVGVLLAGATASAVLVGGEGERARRIAAPLDDHTLLDRDDSRPDRLSRTPAPSDEPSPAPTSAPPAPEPSASEPSREPESGSRGDGRAEPEQEEKEKEEQEEQERQRPEEKPAEEKKEEKKEEAETPDWVHPMPGAVTTSCFGPRWGTVHQGVDLAQPAGTPIRAVGAGTVIYAGWVFSGYGISVVIDHHNGYLTHYAHASETKVWVGQNVKPGQTIALEGSTGDSTGPHLHFEVHQGMWNQIEPTAWLRERGVTIGGC